jgi:hypothetical protein
MLFHPIRVWLVPFSTINKRERIINSPAVGEAGGSNESLEIVSRKTVAKNNAMESKTRSQLLPPQSANI